ncbi:hypothetical protein GCK72_007896 [Caenorhabditis remanei]|uniref:DUF38 domain-containing protein n=1 Tax=Caenorhabditis remanei TaxID=31234 RepID=A0A6A5HMP5_CAERE|nr:hypothetical protein GCK72_007896 [Caenorhabditis remanei]KAF1767936.1 hypothetical protein GCK72_007896 [Caenorhabditis remanei]
MPLGLSYPGLKCVLEHLEAVKRAHIIGRSPGLQKIDKLIPLRLKNLYIGSEEMTFNNLIIRYYYKDDVEFETDKKTFSRQSTESREDRMKKFINYFFCGRSIINVDTLRWFDDLFPDFLPVDMKFIVNSLSAVSFSFNTAIPFIDPRSFPLKTLFTSIANTSIFDIQVVKSAETLNLNLNVDRIVTVEDLKKLNNKKVVFERVYYSRIDFISLIVPLIKYHIETKKDIRTTFVILSVYEDFINYMLREFEQAFGEYRSDLDGVNERFLPESSRFSIPISDKSKIHVYATKGSQKGFYEIIVKPVLGK